MSPGSAESREIALLRNQDSVVVVNMQRQGHEGANREVTCADSLLARVADSEE